MATAPTVISRHHHLLDLLSGVGAGVRISARTGIGGRGWQCRCQPNSAVPDPKMNHGPDLPQLGTNARRVVYAVELNPAQEAANLGTHVNDGPHVPPRARAAHT